MGSDKLGSDPIQLRAQLRWRKHLDLGAPPSQLFGQRHEQLGTDLDHSAQLGDPVVSRGGGFTTASVIDPFGNVVGLMHSPHWAGRH